MGEANWYRPYGTGYARRSLPEMSKTKQIAARAGAMLLSCAGATVLQHGVWAPARSNDQVPRTTSPLKERNALKAKEFL